MEVCPETIIELDEDETLRPLEKKPSCSGLMLRWEPAYTLCSD